MNEEVDLVSEIYASMGLWQSLPTDFEESLLEKFSNHPVEEVQEALSKARYLSKLVHDSGGFYFEPLGTIRDKIDAYLHEKMPGLSERAYQMAKGQIMYMYIK